MSRILFLAFALIGSGLLGGICEAAKSEPAAVAAIFERVSGKVVVRGRWVSTEAETFIVTHGMGGTSPRDRFERLAGELEKAFPAANVLRVDWTSSATLRAFGLPSPWKVAGQIDGVALDLARQLEAAGIDRSRVTLIGESFGNWVNARTAERLAGVHRLLAFNPASELGGYELPDLREWTDIAWSFHTRSCYDTAQPIADRGLLLATPEKAGALAQHTAGIEWLAGRISERDFRWLRTEISLPTGDADHFDAVAGLGGELIEEQPVRVVEEAK